MRPHHDPGLPVKLNLGCGEFPLPGFINVDLQAPADVVGDFTKDFTFTNVQEVRMTHVLEHIPWTRTVETLTLVHSWMVPGAEIIVEVPDMDAIIARGVFDHDAQIAVYGIQSSPGEFHMAGFTVRNLRIALAEAGFANTAAVTFLSEHPARVGFPCLEARATA